MSMNFYDIAIKEVLRFHEAGAATKVIAWTLDKPTS
jgi:hypothetical protein